MSVQSIQFNSKLVFLDFIYFIPSFWIFLVLHFLGFGFNLRLLDIKSWSGPGQMVCSGAQFAVGHLWTGAYALGRGVLALRRAGGVILQVRLGIRVHSWGTLWTVRCGASYRGQVNSA